jgi:hypothetical protein
LSDRAHFFCGAAVGLWAFPQKISAPSDDGNGGKMGISLDLALDLANFNLYTKILFFNRSLYIEYRPIELIFLVELQWVCGHSHREFQLIRTMGTVEKWEFSNIWYWTWRL